MNNAWQNSNNSGTSTGSRAFPPSREFPVSSGIPGPSSLPLGVGEKNSVRSLRDDPSHVLRPKDTQGSRSVLRGYAGLPGRGGAPRLLPQVPEGEAGKAGLVGRLSLLHQAVRLLSRPSLSGFEYPGRSPRVPFGLEDGQGPGEAVHGGAAAAGGEPEDESHRDRRSFHPQRAYLPDRGQ